jgi:hypothetical protein
MYRGANRESEDGPWVESSTRCQCYQQQHRDETQKLGNCSHKEQHVIVIRESVGDVRRKWSKEKDRDERNGLRFDVGPAVVVKVASLACLH